MVTMHAVVKVYTKYILSTGIDNILSMVNWHPAMTSPSSRVFSHNRGSLANVTSMTHTHTRTELTLKY